MRAHQDLSPGGLGIPLFLQTRAGNTTVPPCWFAGATYTTGTVFYERHMPGTELAPR